MNSYKIKKTSGSTVFFTVLLVLSGTRLIFNGISLAMGDLPLIAFILAIFYAVLFAVSLYMVIRGRRCSLTLNDNGLVYTPPLGAEKRLSYQDIQKVSMGGRTYVIYTTDGKKLIKFDDFRTENASKIIAFLKAKGVPTEI